MDDPLLSAPALRLAAVSREFRVATDASDFAFAGVLLQQADSTGWHPVAYVSRKLSSASQAVTEKSTVYRPGRIMLVILRDNANGNARKNCIMMLLIKLLFLCNASNSPVVSMEKWLGLGSIVHVS